MTNKNTIILVVDDERNHADGIAEALEKLCTKAIAVYTVKDALEIIRNQNIDLVITDLRLDDPLDGLTILKEAKTRNTQTEVILITAYATIDTCKEAIKLGAYDYLVKPIDIDQLRTLAGQTGRKVIAARGRWAGAIGVRTQGSSVIGSNLSRIDCCCRDVVTTRGR